MNKPLLFMHDSFAFCKNIFCFFYKIICKKVPLLAARLVAKLKLIFKSSHPEEFLVKGVLKIFSKFTGEHPCQSAISIKLLCKVIEIALRYGCSPVDLLHIIRTPFSKNTSRRILKHFFSKTG